MQTQNQNFLQVTINSQKLNDFLKQIKFLMKQQQETIQEHHRKFTFANNSFKERFTKVQFQIDQKSKKLKKDIFNQALIQKDLLYKSQNELLKKIQEIQDKLKETRTTLAQTKQKLIEVSSKTQFVFQQSKEIRNIKTKNQEFQSNLKNVNSELYKLLNLEKQDKKINQIEQICQQTFFKIIQNDNVRNFMKGGPLIKKIQQKKNHVTQSQALFYASISQKLQKLQKQLLTKDSQNINKVLYPSSGYKRRQLQQKQQPIFNNQALKSLSKENNIQHLLISKDIKLKLQNIEKIICQKNTEFKSQIAQEKDKNILLSQKIQILTRKLQKQKVKMIQLSNSLKRLNDKKIDENMLQNIRFQIRKKTMDYQENLDNKISKDIYEKQRTKLNDRLKIIHQNLIQKADKSEVIKAIKFLQEKIKQIIFLIAGNREDDKEGAIKKKNFTCLSCDKQLQNKLSQLSQGFKLKGSESTGTMMRSTTSRMRRHIRLASTNITPQNAD